jgi:ABC-2 type transport system ATP-binding protein
VIEVAALTQRYGGYTAVRDLSFRVEPGEVVGFLGPNGAGKTTTLKVVSAFLAPSAGRVTVAGCDAEADPLGVRRALGYLPEHCPLYPEMLVRGFLEFVARVRGVERAARRVAVERAAARCLLDDVLERPIAELSKGYRQRVGIAQALVHDPQVVVLDEPTHGLDPNQVLEVRALVRELGRERTVLFSSHVLSEVEATCRRVLVLNQGRLVADATLDDLRRRTSSGAVRVRFASAPADVASALGAHDGVASAGAADDGALLVRPREGTTDLAARVFRFAIDRGLVLTELAPVTLTLEDVFATLTEAAPRG